jgi:lipoate-protein ligase A
MTNTSPSEPAVVHRPPSIINPICFEVPSDYEITANGKKLLGSAQVRKRGVVLQHGTLPLEGDLGRIGEALRFDSEAEREQVKARVRERAATVAEVLGAEVGWAQAAAALRQGFVEALNLSFDELPLSDFELGEARRLHEEKYAARGWNERL